MEKGSRITSQIYHIVYPGNRRGVRALGKTSIDQVDRSDLIALDETTAAIAGSLLRGIVNPNLITFRVIEDQKLPLFHRLCLPGINLEFKKLYGKSFTQFPRCELQWL